MSGRGRRLVLMLIMAGLAALVAGVTIWFLYRAGFEEERARLVETAQSQARLIEAIARFDSVYSRDFPGGAAKASLSQIIDAHGHYRGFGKTGEFTLAQREGQRIVFLLRHRHYDLENPKPVPFEGKLAEPMRRALSGQSGTVVGFDYRGKTVLAAHEPVSELDLGIVAKIDLAEVRAPFVRAGIIAAGVAALIILGGTVLFRRVSEPLIRNLEESEKKYRALFEQAADSVVLVDAATEQLVEFNDLAHEHLGYSREEFRELKIWEIDALEGEAEVTKHVEKVIEAGGDRFETKQRTKGGEIRDVRVSSRPVSIGERAYVFGIWRDITEQKRVEDELRRGSQVDSALSVLSSAVMRTGSSLEEIAALVLQRAKELTGSEHGYVSWIDPETGDNICSMFTEMMARGECSTTGEDRRVAFSKGADGRYGALWGHALNDRKGFYTNAPHTHEASSGTPDGHVPLTAFLTVPAVVGGELVGQVALANPGQAYTDRDLVTVQRLTDIYASAVQRTLAEQTLQRARDELEKRVDERTAELSRINRQLVREVAERKQTEERLRSLSGQLLKVQDRERRRIAGELHDEFGQLLAAAKLGVHRLCDDIPPEREDLRESGERVVKNLDIAIKSIRAMLRTLHPSVLDMLGLGPAIQALATEFGQSVGIPCAVELDVQQLQLDSDSQLAVYRIVQEALTNVAQHAEAGRVEVVVRQAGSRLHVTVRDDGKGTPLEKMRAPVSYGLAGMRERAKNCGGTLTISGPPGEGTVVTLDMPLNPPASA